MMTAVAGRKILNEILNSDYRDLKERIENNPDAVNTIGTCGESPAHIAIYKNNIRMLRMLLEAGADPNIANGSGDTLFHSAARFGYIDHLRLLYETGKCTLLLKNKFLQTALDVANSELHDESLTAIKYFAEYKAAEADEAALHQAVVDGRKQCAAYLVVKMEHDRGHLVKKLVQSTLDTTNDRRNKARIIRGVGGYKNTAFYADFSYNTKIYEAPWPKADMDFFVNYHEGIESIVRTVFACDYVNKSVRVGMQNYLTSHKIRLNVSTYPVPTRDAVIPPPYVPFEDPEQPETSNVSASIDPAVAGTGASSMGPGGALRVNITGGAGGGAGAGALDPLRQRRSPSSSSVTPSSLRARSSPVARSTRSPIGIGQVSGVRHSIGQQQQQPQGSNSANVASPPGSPTARAAAVVQRRPSIMGLRQMKQEQQQQQQSEEGRQVQENAVSFKNSGGPGLDISVAEVATGADEAGAGAGASLVLPTGQEQSRSRGLGLGQSQSAKTPTIPRRLASINIAGGGAGPGGSMSHSTK
jgi:hypothetical protein